MPAGALTPPEVGALGAQGHPTLLSLRAGCFSFSGPFLGHFVPQPASSACWLRLFCSSPVVTSRHRPHKQIDPQNGPASRWSLPFPARAGHLLPSGCRRLGPCLRGTGDGQPLLASSLGRPLSRSQKRGVGVGGSSCACLPLGLLIQHSTWGSMLVLASVSSSIRWGHSALWGFAVRIHACVLCPGCGCRPCSCFASALTWGLGGSSPSLRSCPSGRAAGAGVRGGGGGALAHGDLGREHAAPLELEDTGASPPQRLGDPGSG